MTVAEWRAANPEKMRQYQAKYRAKNRDRCNAANDAWRVKNREAINADLRRRYAEDPQRKLQLRTGCRKHQASKRRAVPSWAQGEWEQLVAAEAYELASIRSEATGVEWHVDHTVPLQSRQVCGLHCAANLKVIPALANLKKSNLTWPDMP